MAPARQSRRSTHMKSSTSRASVAPHQIDGVPSEVMALEHCATWQPSVPFFGPS